jgi:uncharacterized membrane protein YraQ (UPF0718 family)
MGKEDSMLYLFIITGVLVIISFLLNREKTLTGLKIALKRFIKILPALTLMMLLVSLTLYFIPEQIITQYLADGNRYLNTFTASLFGSITIMPGFIAFPLAGILKDRGVTYMVISAFTTTLMMVGVLTFPVEKLYFGAKVAVIRNIVSLGIAFCVAFATGLFFGELC